MNIKLETIPPYKIIYIRKIGPYGSSNIQTMERLKHCAKKKNLLNSNSIVLGIALDNPNVTEPNNCRYDTCLVVPNNFSNNDDSLEHGNLVGGKHCVFKISHTAESVQKAWDDIFPEMTKNGYKFDDTRPIIERYAVQLVSKDFCEICVPIL